MSTNWILSTHGEPLVELRRFLARVWEYAGLEGMIVPAYGHGEAGVSPVLLENSEELDAADPFVPLMPMNAARLVLEQACRSSGGASPALRLGAVLRACEARAVEEIARREALNLQGWMFISVDCLGSFPLDEVEWRLRKVGAIEHLTQAALRFARQGGVAAYRYRRACQMCVSPLAPQAELSIELIGMPVKEFVLVAADDEATAEQLRLAELTSGLAPEAYLWQRERVSQRLRERHMSRRQAMIASLPSELPERPEELIAFLAACAPCRACLEVCPVYAGELSSSQAGEPVSVEEIRQWLAACAQCGMCEQACPQGLPLAAVHASLARALLETSVEV